MEDVNSEKTVEFNRTEFDAFDSIPNNESIVDQIDSGKFIIKNSISISLEFVLLKPISENCIKNQHQMISFHKHIEMYENHYQDSNLLTPAENNTNWFNIDKTRYLRSEIAKFCPFCEKNYIRMVPHFKSAHPKSEVFVSRISPKMVEMLTQNTQSFTKHPTKFKYVKTVCIFCEEEKEFSCNYWMNHYRSHTGEYAYKCVICDKECSTPSHCDSSAYGFIDEINIEENTFYGYRCKECNYVQIDEERMCNHLHEQHEFTNIHNRYEQFTLLPAFNTFSPQHNKYAHENLSTNGNILFEGMFELEI